MANREKQVGSICPAVRLSTDVLPTPNKAPQVLWLPQQGGAGLASAAPQRTSSL